MPNWLGLSSRQNNFKVTAFAPSNMKLEALIKMAEMISIVISRERELSFLYRFSNVCSQNNPDQRLVEDY